MTNRLRLFLVLLVTCVVTCRFAVAQQPVPAPTPTPAPVASPTPAPQASPSATRKVPPQTSLEDASGSTSPVPISSTLYPGSTVHAFRGKDNFGFRVEGDFRYRSVTGEGERSGTYLAATRLTSDWVRANPLNRDERGGVRLQMMLETDQQGTAIRQLRFSEAYGYYTFLTGGVSARARAGQFVIPFGLLAVYDTALQPIQPIYDKALGLRVDTGVMLEGRYDVYRYAGSITTGTGPNHLETQKNAIIAFRLSRAVTLPKIGPVEIGGSLLSGKLPRTDFDTRLLPSGTIDTPATVKSTRFAVDGQLFRDPWTVRGELIFGSDVNSAVFGYFAEGDYRLSKTVALEVYSKRWDFPDKPSSATSIGFGASYKPPVLINDRLNLTFRGLFEFERNVPVPGMGNTQVFHRLTLQTFILY